MDRIRIALIGYGNVGQAFARMLKRREDYIKETFGLEPVITAISTGRHGGITNAGGLDKKHVITANKGPIAWHYRELRDLAKKQGVQLCYEATVMDGVPVYNMAQETLRGCKITEIKGILNATTNFILTEMEKGVSYEDAIEEGRRQGFVEADPSMDLDGWDASAKLTALMNVLMDETITPMDIDRIGISGITKEDLDKAAAGGKKIKLLCHGYLKDGKAIGEVKPTLIDKNDMAAIMDATMSYVTVNTDLMGEVTVVEHAFEPEIDHTAYGVLSDLLKILTKTR